MPAHETLTVSRLDLGLPHLIRKARDLQAGDSLLVDVSRIKSVYANGAVPFAAALDFFRTRGVTVDLAGGDTGNIGRTHLSDPITVDRFKRGGTRLTHTVWQYRNEQEAQFLADKFVEALVDQVRCENGVVDTFNWCLYEVMDNVFQHSGAPHGFVMMQIQQTARRAVVAIGDSGRGIQLSLAKSDIATLDRARIAEAHLAIAHAVEQGVTSKGKLNQGNGLFG